MQSNIPSHQNTYGGGGSNVILSRRCASMFSVSTALCLFDLVPPADYQTEGSYDNPTVSRALFTNLVSGVRDLSGIGITVSVNV